MQLLTEQSVEISRPIAAVYQYTTNLEHFGAWFPGVLAIRSVDDSPHARPGKAYLETAAAGLGRKQQIRVVVQEATLDQRLVTEGDLRPLMPRMEIAFDVSGDDGCRVTWRMFSRNEGALVRWLVLPLARRVIRKRATIAMTRLKRRLETGS